MCIVDLFTLMSNSDKYIKHDSLKIKIKEKVGEGSSGLAFLLENGDVLKIYKNSVAGSAKLIESNSILPVENENREIQLFFKIIKFKINEVGIVKPLSLGIVYNEFVFEDTVICKDTYYSILPFYEKVSKGILVKYNLYNLILEIINSELSIEKYLKVFHLDITLENLVRHKGKLMLIDYNLTKSISAGEYSVNTNHFNTEETCKLKLIPLYYIFLLIISLLFNTKKIYFNDKLLVNYLYILSKKLKMKVYSLIYNGLSLKYDVLVFYRKFISA